MRRTLERHQVAIYLSAFVVGGLAGLRTKPLPAWLAHDAALARYQIEVRQTEERAHAEAEAARAAQDQYDRDYAAWQEQVRLCRTGFRPACTARPAWVAPAQ